MDILCIGFSKANTAPFTYLFLRYCWNHLPWNWRSISITNTLVPLPLLLIFFDATYAGMHSILHWQCLYPYIHKHHHVQKAPSRANVDAVNVHPIEFVLGEYNHWFIVYVWASFLGWPLHAAGALIFLVVGGLLAGINHTRYDIVVAVPVPRQLLLMLPIWPRRRSLFDHGCAGDTFWTMVPLYDSKAHDVHHRIPQSKYVHRTLVIVAILRGVIHDRCRLI
jgi:sterol desaturase/sphingolipid hydroxylase (fatty acid hydroxylase superfamily)